MKKQFKKPDSKSDKTQAYLLINKIIHLLKNKPVTVKFVIKKSLKYCYGDITFTDLGTAETIRIGLFYPIVPVIIHECIHHLHPEWSETKVTKWEHTVRRYISIKDALKILKLFINIFE